MSSLFADGPLDGRAAGMRRDPDAQALVEQVTAAVPPTLHERGVDGARAYFEERTAAAPPGPTVASVTDHNIPTDGRFVPVRVYAPGAGEPLPVVVYLHGGGWVIGSIASSDAFCRRVAATAPCVLVSVGYRLAPEHPFPAAIEDAAVALTWAATHASAWGGDARRLVALGDSAGGNLATVAVRRLLAAGGPAVARQILAYPGTTAERTATPGGYGDEWPLADADRTWFLDQYVREEQRTHPDVAPLLGDVTGLPPTTLLLGGCDPLMADGLRYAEHLWRAGVPVDLHVFAGQIHGFLTYDPAMLARSAEALGLVANAIRSATPR